MTKTNNDNNTPVNPGEEVILTSLTFLEPGRQWLPIGQKQRIHSYEESKELYDGKYLHHIAKELQKNYDIEEIKKMRLFKTNRYSATCKAFENLTLGEKPVFISNNTKLNEILKAQKIRALQKTALIDLQRFGHSILKIRADESGYKIDCISPKYWFPVVNPSDIRDVEYHVIAQDYWQDRKQYLAVDIYRKDGSVESYTCTLNGNIIGAKIEDNGIIQTGFDGFLVFPIGISADSMEIFSKSDFDNYKNIVLNIETEITSLLWRLSKQGMFIYGSENALEYDNENKEWKFKKDNYLAMLEGDKPPGYVTFDVNAQASLESINKMEKEYYKASQTTPAMFNEDVANSAASGTALKRQLQVPLMKSADFAETLSDPFEECLNAYAQLANIGDLSDLEIEFNDGLISDLAEDILNENARILAGTQSKVSAIMKLDDISKEKATEKLQEIEAEQPNQGIM